MNIIFSLKNHFQFDCLFMIFCTQFVIDNDDNVVVLWWHVCVCIHYILIVIICLCLCIHDILWLWLMIFWWWWRAYCFYDMFVCVFMLFCTLFVIDNYYDDLFVFWRHNDKFDDWWHVCVFMIFCFMFVIDNDNDVFVCLWYFVLILWLIMMMMCLFFDDMFVFVFSWYFVLYYWLIMMVCYLMTCLCLCVHDILFSIIDDIFIVWLSFYGSVWRVYCTYRLKVRGEGLIYIYNWWHVHCLSFICMVRFGECIVLIG